MKNHPNRKKVDELFSKAKANASLPDQDYDVNVEEIIIGESLKADIKVSWRLLIKEGPYDGVIVYKNNILSSLNSVNQFKRDLAICNYHPENITEVFDNHEPLIGCHLRVKQVTRNGYTSIYFLELLSAADVESDSNDQVGEADDFITE